MNGKGLKILKGFEEQERIRREKLPLAMPYHDKVEIAGGFEQVSWDEPCPPYACTACGCLIAAEYADKHRERCPV